MSLALGVYGLPLMLDQSLRVASGGFGRTGPIVTTDRIMFMAAAGVMTCLVVLPMVGFVLGLLGIYRQKKEIELSALASIMHGTLLTMMCMMMQNSNDVNAYLNIFQLAIGHQIA